MSLNDLNNLQPNIILIVLGSLFVLIGASGRIFIEKFSVAVASIGPRVLISILGVAMLGVGIIGPNKLFPSEPKTDQSQSKPDQSHAEPWFRKISGTYTGIATSKGVDYPASTTFSVDAQGNITGTYVIEEPQKMAGGKLEKAMILGLGSIQFEWKDDYGHGVLRVVFSEDLNSFTGNWGDDNQLTLDYKWSGKKK